MFLEPNNIHQVDVCVQTSNINVEAGVQAANIYVDTGMQTSARIWYETLKNWITELLSINSSEIQGATPTDVRVENWIDNLDSTQLVSSPTMNSVTSNMPNLIDVGPSQIGEPLFEHSKIISSEVITNLALPEYSTAANGFIDSISTISVFLEASGYIIN